MRNPAVILITLVVILSSPVLQTAWAQSDLRSGRFTTSDGLELHYLEAGAGPAIVFVPGWTMPAEIWAPQLRHFSSTHRVIALDPRSQGRSQKATEGHYLARRGQDIGELIEHLDAAPAVAVGWSLAALEVLEYARQFGTDAFRAVVLVDMFIGTDLEPGAPHPLNEVLEGIVTRAQLDRAGFAREFATGIHRSPQSGEYIDAIVAASLATPTNTAVTLLANLVLMGSGDWRPALDALDRPLLYVAAPAYADQAREVRARRPDALAEVFENAGHALFVDEPERFNQLLEEFLASVPDTFMR